MYLRTVDMIYEPSGMAAPTMEEVRFEARELVQRSGWGVPLILALRKIHNPYRREAVARSLMDRWNEMLRDRDEQTFYYDGDGNGCFCWIDAESDFMRVIRHSTAEQVDWEQHHTHQTPQNRPMQTPTIRPMQATQNNQYNAPVYYGCTFTTNNHTTNNYYSLAPQGEEARQQTTDCLLFTRKARQEGRETEIIESLQQSISGRNDKARALVDTIRQWQREGYIDPNYNARVMYDQLNKIIPLPFQYGGFRKYYNE